MKSPSRSRDLLLPIVTLVIIALLTWLAIVSPGFEKVILYSLGGIIAIGAVLGLGSLFFDLFYQPADTVYGIVPDANNKGIHVFTKTMGAPHKYGISPFSQINHYYIQDDGHSYSDALFSVRDPDGTSVEKILLSPEWEKTKEGARQKEGLIFAPSLAKPTSKYHVIIQDAPPKEHQPDTIYIFSKEQAFFSKLFFPGSRHGLKIFGSCDQRETNRFISDERLILLIQTGLIGFFRVLSVVSFDVKNGKKMWRKSI